MEENTSESQDIYASVRYPGDVAFYDVPKDVFDELPAEAKSGSQYTWKTLKIGSTSITFFVADE